ncbi:MAG TPA: hypothetical protein VH678_11965 [Xanthobacteraceae bacterium]|jgi:hypothetical protein
MSDYTTIHGPGLDARALLKIGLAVIACLAALSGIAVAVMLGQIGNARGELESVMASLSAVNDRLARVERSVDATRAKLNETARTEQPTVSTIPQPTVSVPPKVVAGFYLTEEEAELIREFLKIPRKHANATAKMAVWARVPAQATKPLPDALVGKLEKLKGLRYAVDANNAIALIEPSSSIVIALI